MDQARLTEQLQHWNERVEIDSQQRLVRNVALAGPLSRNGYQYTEEALRDGARLYLHKPVFLDHQSSRGRGLDRSTRDLVGTVVEAVFEDGRIRGSIKVLDTDAGETFLKLVEAQAPGVGMSHVVVAQRSGDGKLVERLVDVLSVDAVVNPATTTTFQESAEPPSPETAMEDGPAVLEESLRQEVLELRREAAELREQITRLRSRERAWELLLESGLPSEAITACFREQLLRCGSESACREMIADRQSCLGSGGRQPHPVSSRQRGSESAASSDGAFLSAIRRRSA